MNMAAKNFTVDITNWAAKAGGNIRAVVSKTVIDLGEEIVERTPVGDPDKWAHPERAPAGYVGGRARGSWQYGFNAPPSGDPGTIDSSGDLANARIRAGVAANQVPGVHYITSVLPYMRPLEYEAHSKQAPEGMVRKTIMEFQRFIEANVAGLNK